MSQTSLHILPMRITDLIELQKRGARITCSPDFKIVPVDFSHRTCRFRALVFLCRFSGMVDRQSYTFRKCYARGCSHDQCPRVAQAVMIANHYLQRDYHRLEQCGIEIEKKLFTLEEAAVELLDLKEDQSRGMLLDDYLRMAKEGQNIGASVSLEYVPATEHFEYRKNDQTFLMASFAMEARGESATCQRCLGCYPTELEEEARPVQIRVANDRLSHLYAEFDQCSIQYEKQFFV
jgi:hypothetical protein